MAYVFDTDVLIDYLRGNPAAVDAVELRIDTAYLSTMTVAEIHQGVRESERTAVTRAMSAFTLLPISAEIAEMGGLFRRDYKDQGAGLADCLIAAMAEVHGLTLVTLNRRHYPMLHQVETPYVKH